MPGPWPALSFPLNILCPISHFNGFSHDVDEKTPVIQAGEGLEQPRIVQSVHAHGRRLELVDFEVLSNINDSITKYLALPIMESQNNMLKV